MRPRTILKSVNAAAPREVAFDDRKLAALLALNDAAFPDEAALLRHLRRGRTVRMIVSAYRLKPEDQFRIAAG